MAPIDNIFVHGIDVGLGTEVLFQHFLAWHGIKRDAVESASSFIGLLFGLRLGVRRFLYGGGVLSISPQGVDQGIAAGGFDPDFDRAEIDGAHVEDGSAL